MHLHTPHLTSITVPEYKAANIDDTLAIDEELEFTISLADIIEPDTLRDSGPFASGESESTTANRSTVGGVAVGHWLDIADFLVLVEGRGKVGVEFTSTIGTPHETSREAGAGATAPGAANSFGITVTTVWKG